MEELQQKGYNERHRAFLQALMARGNVTFEEARAIIAAIHTAEAGDEGDVRSEQIEDEAVTAYLELVSEAASLFDYEIRTTVHQLSKQRIWAFVNTTSDPQTQLATTFSPEEIAFIKRVLDGMFDKFNRPRMEVLAITEMQAIKFARPPRPTSLMNAAGASQPTADKGLKHSEVENVLANLVDGGWFEKSRNGFYSLTPRALLELRPWLTNTYNDPDAEPGEWQRVKFCEACKDIVTTGRRCAELSCSLRLHDICQETFRRVQRSNQCPRCTKEWTGENYVGERAVTMTEAYQKGRKRSGGKRRSTLADEIIQLASADAERSDSERDAGGDE